MAESASQETTTGTIVQRRHIMVLWQVLLASLVLHVVVVFAFSPGIFVKEDTSPEGLLKTARQLAEEEKYQEALEIYQQIQLKKPQIPLVFQDAEEDMRRVRLKALEAERKAAEQTKEGEEGEGEKPEGPEEGEGGEGGETKPPDETAPTPPVDLPSLPEIGGEDI